MFTVKGAFFTDIITNSSSVVYTWATSKENLYSIIDEVLVEIGSEKKARDLFDIYIVSSDMFDWLRDVCEEEEYAEFFTSFDMEEFLSLNYKEQYKKLKELPLVEQERLTNLYSQNSDSYTNSSYVVVTKSGQESRITRLIGNLFDSAETYDG